MELNLCPACDAFVRGTWTSCQACGAELGVHTSVDAEAPTWENAEALSESPVWEEAPIEAPEVNVEVLAEEPAPVEVVAETPEVAAEQEEVAEPFQLAGALGKRESAESVQSFNGQPTPQPESSIATEEPAQPGVWENSFDGAEPTFTAFSFFESDEDSYNSDYAALAGGAPLDTEHNLTVPPIEKKERKRLSDSSFGAALTSRKSLLIVGAIAGVIGVLSVLSFLTVLFFNSAAPATNEAATPTTALPSQWKSYSAPMDLYTVNLPSEPTTKIDGNSVLMRSEVPNSKAAVEVYAVRLDPTRDKTADQQLLLRQLQATALDRGTAVSSSTFQNVDKTRYLAAHFADGAKTLNGDAQFFIKGNTLYAAWLLTPSDVGDPGVFSELFEGFKPVNVG